MHRIIASRKFQKRLIELADSTQRTASEGGFFAAIKADKVEVGPIISGLTDEFTFDPELMHHDDFVALLRNFELIKNCEKWIHVHSHPFLGLAAPSQHDLYAHYQRKKGFELDITPDLYKISPKPHISVIVGTADSYDLYVRSGVNVTFFDHENPKAHLKWKLTHGTYHEETQKQYDALGIRLHFANFPINRETDLPRIKFSREEAKRITEVVLKTR